MKKLIFTIAFSIGFQLAAGQHMWSMEECMAYAADHSPEVEQVRWDLATAKANQSEAIADFFPSVSAQVGGQYNWGRNIDPESNTYNNVTTFNNGYGLYASLTIFDGGQTFNRYKQARVERQKSLNAVEMRRDDRAIAAMMAFVDAVYYQGAIKIAMARADHSKNVLRQTQLQEELGIKGHPDVAQAQATVADDEYNLVHQRNLFTQAMLNLRAAMNYPQDKEMLLDTMMTNAAPMPLYGSDDAETVYSIAQHTNPTAINAEMTVQSSRYSYRVAKGSLMPTISFNAGISTSYFRNLSGDYTTPSFREQFRNNRGEYISATLSIPIFSNLGRVSNVKRAKYALRRAEAVKEEQLRKLHDDVIAAVTDRNGYAMEILSLQAKVDADYEAYMLNRRRYEEGLISIIDQQLTANTYFASQLSLLQKQMLYVLKNKLVDYYKGNSLWMSK